MKLSKLKTVKEACKAKKIGLRFVDEYAKVNDYGNVFLKWNGDYDHILCKLTEKEHEEFIKNA